MKIIKLFDGNYVGYLIRLHDGSDATPKINTNMTKKSIADRKQLQNIEKMIDICME